VHKNSCYCRNRCVADVVGGFSVGGRGAHFAMGLFGNVEMQDVTP
jgi:hypothetical protein